MPIERYEIVDFPGSATLSVTEMVQDDQIAERLGAIYGRIFPLVGDAMSGPPFARWHVYNKTATGAEFQMEAGIPTSRPIDGDGIAVPSSLPKGRLLQALHVGSYDQLTEAYGQVMEYMAANNLDAAGPPWDWYIEDPHEVGMDRVKTLICWPIA